jgi:carboxymethylenebutenolidase
MSAHGRALAEPGDAKSMAEAHKHDAPTATPAATMEPRVPVEGRDVVYGKGTAGELKGYLARPKDAKGPLPGLIVIHEWWGLNDNIRAMTRRLAGEGYTALAVDLYAGRTASDPESAMKMMQATNDNEAAGIANVKAAYDYLVNDQKAGKVGTIGWCFGGGWSLRTALALPDKVDATVMYYGQPVTDPQKLAPLKMPILGNFAGDDQGIPPNGGERLREGAQGRRQERGHQDLRGSEPRVRKSLGQGLQARGGRGCLEAHGRFLCKNLK